MGWGSACRGIGYPRRMRRIVTASFGSDIVRIPPDPPNRFEPLHVELDPALEPFREANHAER